MVWVGGLGQVSPVVPGEIGQKKYEQGNGGCNEACCVSSAAAAAAAAAAVD